MCRERNTTTKRIKRENTQIYISVCSKYICVCAFVTFVPLIEKEERKGHGRFWNNVQALQLVSERGFENPDVSPSCGWSTSHSSQQHARGWEVAGLHTGQRLTGKVGSPSGKVWSRGVRWEAQRGNMWGQSGKVWSQSGKGLHHSGTVVGSKMGFNW